MFLSVYKTKSEQLPGPKAGRSNNVGQPQIGQLISGNGKKMPAEQCSKKKTLLSRLSFTMRFPRFDYCTTTRFTASGKPSDLTRMR